jgi:hypothetical protein
MWKCCLEFRKSSSARTGDLPLGLSESRLSIGLSRRNCFADRLLQTSVLRRACPKFKFTAQISRTKYRPILRCDLTWPCTEEVESDARPLKPGTAISEPTKRSEPTESSCNDFILWEIRQEGFKLRAVQITELSSLPNKKASDSLSLLDRQSYKFPLLPVLQPTQYPLAMRSYGTVTSCSTGPKFLACRSK